MKIMKNILIFLFISLFFVLFHKYLLCLECSFAKFKTLNHIQINNPINNNEVLANN